MLIEKREGGHWAQTRRRPGKDPSCAIFSKSRRFEDIKHDTEMSGAECDIRENVDTNECPNIFVSTKLHE